MARVAVAVARGWAAVEARGVRAWAAAVTSAANSEAGAAGVEGERGVAVRAVVARAVVAGMVVDGAAAREAAARVVAA